MDSNRLSQVETPQLQNTINQVQKDPGFSKLCPILVGVSGGSASGKTTLCKRVQESLGINCFILSQDSFYKSLPEGVDISEFNFDHPDALDFDLCYQVLQKLMVRQPAKIPQYDFKTSSRTGVWDEVLPADLILLEGIHAFHDERIVNLMNLKIFVSCDDDIRLYRRVIRDVNERGREVTGILYVYHKFVKPAFSDYIKPAMKHANIIVPGIGDTSVAINFVVDNLRLQLSRFEDMKSNQAEKNVFFADILDNVWLNANDKTNTSGEVSQSEEFKPAKSNRIHFLRDHSTKKECLNLLSIITDSNFSRTTFMLCMSRFAIYGIKMFKRKSKKVNYTDIASIHNELSLSESKIRLNQIQSLSLVTHFLDQSKSKEIKQKIKTILEENENIKTLYVIALFSDIDTMTDLVQFDPKIHIINILCVGKLDKLLSQFKEKSKQEFDFSSNPQVITKVQELISSEIEDYDPLLDLKMKVSQSEGSGKTHTTAEHDHI